MQVSSAASCRSQQMLIQTPDIRRFPGPVQSVEVIANDEEEDLAEREQILDVLAAQVGILPFIGHLVVVGREHEQAVDDRLVQESQIFTRRRCSAAEARPR
jgi:hypothetical protein